jgi:esterase/lipase superfamily enzyme
VAWLRRQVVVSFTWDSAGRTLSYPHEEFMAECGTLSDHLANLIRRLLHIKLVTSISNVLTGRDCAP